MNFSTNDIAGLQIDDSQLKNMCLCELEKLLLKNGRSLKEFESMPYPSQIDVSNFDNRFLVDELSYDREQMTAMHQSLMKNMTVEQRAAYDEIISSVHSKSGGFFSYMVMEVLERHLFGIHYLLDFEQRA